MAVIFSKTAQLYLKRKGVRQALIRPGWRMAASTDRIPPVDPQAVDALRERPEQDSPAGGVPTKSFPFGNIRI